MEGSFAAYIAHAGLGLQVLYSHYNKIETAKRWARIAAGEAGCGWRAKVYSVTHVYVFDKKNGVWDKSCR